MILFSYYVFNDNETDALMVNNAYSIDSENHLIHICGLEKTMIQMITKELRR